MTDIDDDWDASDERDQDPDDEWYDDDDRHEPDPEDWEQAKAHAEYAEHCEQAHGGDHCDCRPPLRDRLRDAFHRARCLLHRPRWYTDEPPF